MFSAYYALFHLLVYDASWFMIAGPSRTFLRHALGRTFSHTNMREAARAFASQTPAPKVSKLLGGLPVQADLAQVATAFMDLQQARHEADYDLTRRFTRQEVSDLIEQAEEAFSSWKRVRPSPQGETFLVSLLILANMRI